MKIKYKHHFYSDEGNYEVEIPDDTVFIYVDGDIGESLYDGFNHYLGATKSKIEELNTYYGVCLYNEFPDITLISFNNVIFESEIKIISSKEFYEIFDIGNYYIFRSTKERVLPIFGEEKVIKDIEVIPSKPISVTKILSIESQNRITTFTAHINSWLGNKQFPSIIIEDFISLLNLTNDIHWKIEIKRNCEQEFINYINQTLALVKYQVVSDQPSEAV